ncbi:amidase [Brevibacterium sp. 5221]|uniref:Amidase n=1 Tax=Brevibacterium rongguiense TaxID=2695267 RepID=A0A6N9H9C1_9MICO|nr:amidase [Brevibacterium rongguiense]MYM20613.1 amidase [Brevibacterium rongguiense]
MEPTQTLADLSADQLREGYEAGRFEPGEVLAAVGERIAACEPTINALWDESVAAARPAAEASAARWRAGHPLSRLDGVPVTLKENIARAGVAMPAGHAAGDPQPEAQDAPIAQRMAEAGALVVGSTVMPDWGMLSSGVSSRHGITRSPLDPALTTGGSSAGAGAAAAAGYGPIHIGSDIGGSIRLPGTWLGLATLKPSFGRVPLSAPYLGRCAGPLARTVGDLVAAMDIIGRPDVRDYSQLPPLTGGYGADFDPVGARIAVHTDAGCGSPVDPEVAAAVDAAAERFAAAGAQVTRIDPFMDEELLADVDRFWRVRSWADLRALPVAEREKILPYVRQWCIRGSDISGVEVLRCYHSIQRMRQATVAATAAYDLVLSPVAPTAAFPAEWPMPFNDPDLPMLHVGFTVPYNMSEQPAATVLAGYTGDGRTIGVQLAGPRFADPQVLAAAAWFEADAALPAPRRTVGTAG